jgi:hypothetical protein
VHANSLLEKHVDVIYLLKDECQVPLNTAPRRVFFPQQRMLQGQDMNCGIIGLELYVPKKVSQID